MTVATAPKVPPPKPSPPPSGGSPKASGTRKVQIRQPQTLAAIIHLFAVEGWGKTTLAAYAPSPLILMGQGEAGYDTLLTAGRVPAVSADTVTTWADLTGWLADLASDQQGIKTLVLDSLTAYQGLLFEKVTREKFDGDPSKFWSFWHGPQAAQVEWQAMLSQLERLRDTHRMNILMLDHAGVQKVQNPVGPDYDRFTSGLEHKCIGPTTKKVADAVLFGSFLNEVFKENSKDRKAKSLADGGSKRVMYTEHRDAFDAKNRFGMPPLIEFGTDPADMYRSLWHWITPGAHNS